MLASGWAPRVQIGPRGLSKIIPIALGLSYLVLAWTMYRTRPPKGLERYEDEFKGTDFTSGSFKFPDAPQFGSRKEAADWVIAQAQALARNSHAEFNAKIVSDTEIELDLGSFYWLTLDQIGQIMGLGEKHGFRLVVHGSSNNPFVPGEFYKKD